MNTEDAKLTAREFDEKHGSYIIGEDRAWMYFEDGCYREVNPLGARCCPIDPYRRSQFVVAYCTAKLQLAVDEFTHFKQNLLSRTNASANSRVCGPAPDQGAIEHLKSLKGKVRIYEQKLAEAEEKVENLKPDSMRQSEEMDVELRQECQSVLGEIRQIEI